MLSIILLIIHTLLRILVPKNINNISLIFELRKIDILTFINLPSNKELHSLSFELAVIIVGTIIIMVNSNFKRSKGQSELNTYPSNWYFESRQDSNSFSQISL